MSDRRSGKDRRVNEDRRRGNTASIFSIDNRRLKQQRVNKKRRQAGSPNNKGRRSEIDQRNFSYAGIIPERRSGKERRGPIQKPTD